MVVASTVTNTYRNPVQTGFNPDPSWVYVEGQGYFMATSTFEMFPGLPIYHSVDLVDWTLIGHALNRRAQGVDMRTNEANSGLWAPTLRYNNGRFYVACCCFYRMEIPGGTRKTYVPPLGFFVSTDDIFDDSKWSDAIYFEEQGFDQDLFFDDDGQVYLTTTTIELGPVGIDDAINASYTNLVDLRNGRSLSAPVKVVDSSLGIAEGCHIIKKDEFYYLFSAEGGTQEGHRECVYRAEKPLGPYSLPPDGVNPIVYNGLHPVIRNTGHADVIKGANGRWWACFLGVRPVHPKEDESRMLSQLGRESFMAPVEWVDGWPVVNGGKEIEIIGKAEGLTFKEEQQSWEADFGRKDVELGWYTVRTPLRNCYDFFERPGSLALRGSGYTLDIDESPAMLLRKQPAFNVNWETEIEFSPRKLGEEAGTTAWVQKEAYGALLIRRSATDESVNEVVFRSTGDDRNPIDRATFPLPAGVSSAKLVIRARTQRYDFLFQAAGSDDLVHAGSLAAVLLKPLFTGAHLGVFAQGAEGRPCLSSAFFNYARWNLAKEE